MNGDLPAGLFHEAMVTLGTVGLPIFAVLFAVGLLVGVLQAVTQVNDSAVGSVPRLLAVGVACVLFGGWMLERLAAFFHAAVLRMAGG